MLKTEICDDVRDECSKYGTVFELKIPRPSGGSRQSAGVGKIYVKFDNADSASQALKALAGRKFQDRTVVTSYFSEVIRTPCPWGSKANAGIKENFEVNAW